MKKDVLEWLQDWFLQNCDGKWEKEKRIFIETIDNPGWLFKLQLKNSKYEKKIINTIEVERTELDWYHFLIKTEEKELLLAGGPFNLNEMIHCFRNWTEDKKEIHQSNILENEIINWMQKWYYDQCDGDWEHSERFIIKTAEYGWYFSMFLEETCCEDKTFNMVKLEKSKNDWIECFVKEGKFIGKGGPFNLIDILKIFKEWAEKYNPNIS